MKGQEKCRCMLRGARADDAVRTRAADKHTAVVHALCAPGHVRVDEALSLLGEEQNGVADPQRALHLLVHRLRNASRSHINGATSLQPNGRRRARS